MVADGPAEVLRGGQSRVLVVSGEAGVGKTALLDSAISPASGFRVMRAVGVESEMELAFAAMQQLCAPLLDRLDRLPGPQQDALGVAFGLRVGDAPDRFLSPAHTLNPPLGSTDPARAPAACQREVQQS
jgi:hypothetical protein